MRYQISLLTFGLLAALTATTLTAADKPLAVGDPAPGFELKDQDGKTHTLESLAAKGPVAIVFYRSADW